MKFNIKIIIFAIITLGLCFYVFFYEANKVDSRQNIEKRILKFDIDQVSYFQFIKENSKIGFQKSETGWKLLEPILEDADSDKVSEFLTSLRDENYLAIVKTTDTVFTDVELSEYGLNKPAITFNFKNNSGLTSKIIVGSVKNFEGHSYVYVDGEKQIWLAGPNWSLRSQENLIDYREKRIFRDSVSNVQKMTLKTLQESIILIRENNNWKLEGSPSVIDQNMVRSILKKIHDTQIEEYIFEGEPSQSILKETEMDKSLVSVELQTDKFVWSVKLNINKSKAALYLLSDRPTYLARVSPLIWESVAALTADSLRDRLTAFNFKAEEVRKIYFKNEGNETNLIFNSGSWLAGPTGGPYINVDQDAVVSKIKKMHDLKISQFLDQDVKSIFTGDNMLILKTERDNLLLQLNWGPEFKMTKFGQEQSYYYARTQLSDTIFAIEKDLISDLNLKLDKLMRKNTKNETETVPILPAEVVESPEK